MVVQTLHLRWRNTISYFRNSHLKYNYIYTFFLNPDTFRHKLHHFQHFRCCISLFKRNASRARNIYLPGDFATALEEIMWHFISHHSWTCNILLWMLRRFHSIWSETICSNRQLSVMWKIYAPIPNIIWGIKSRGLNGSFLNLISEDLIGYNL